MTQREEFEKFWMKHCNENHLYCNLFRNSLDMYIDTYAEYAFKGWKEAKAQPQWIPVSERLPNHDSGKWSDPVIALSDIGLVFRLSYCGGWQRTGDFMSTGSSKVTHWMPLPAVPEQNK